MVPNGDGEALETGQRSIVCDVVGGDTYIACGTRGTRPRANLPEQCSRESHKLG